MALYGRARNTRLLVITLVMASLLIITVDYRGGQRGPFEVAGRATSTVVGAMQAGVSKVLHPIAAFVGGVAHIGSLKAENDQLRARVRQLEAQSGTTDSTQRVNDALLKLFSLQGTLNLRGVAARVIAESVGNFEWSVNIDKGSSRGVKLNMAVVMGDGLVGHVVEVASNTSKVELIIDPASAVAGRLANSGETGVVTGQKFRDLTMGLVSPDARIVPDEQVVTAGYQGGLYPPEIPIGVVSHTYEREGSIAKTIAIRPAVDFTSLEYVLVVFTKP